MNTEFITRKIRSSDLSIVEICKRAKIARQTIYSLMDGKGTPDLNTILKICKVLNFNGTEIAITLGIKGEK